MTKAAINIAGVALLSILLVDLHWTGIDKLEPLPVQVDTLSVFVTHEWTGPRSDLVQSLPFELSAIAPNHWHVGDNDYTADEMKATATWVQQAHAITPPDKDWIVVVDADSIHSGPLPSDWSAIVAIVDEVKK